MTTHAHRKGEFPSKLRPAKVIVKDVAYHVKHAEKHIQIVRSAHDVHASSSSPSVRATQLLIAARSAKKAEKHAAGVEAASPGTSLAHLARTQATEAKSHYDVMQESKITGVTVKKTSSGKTKIVEAFDEKKQVAPQDIGKLATKHAFDKTKIASEDPTIVNQKIAAEAHHEAQQFHQHDEKTLKLHQKMENHHTNRAEATPLDGTVANDAAKADIKKTVSKLQNSADISNARHASENAASSSDISDKYSTAANHVSSAKKHEDAAEAHRQAGDPNGKAMYHDEEARRHREASEAASPVTANKSGFTKGQQIHVDGEPAVVLDGQRRSGDQVLVARHSTGITELVDRSRTSLISPELPHNVIPSHRQLHDELNRSDVDHIERTVSAREIGSHGYFEPGGGHLDEIRSAEARHAMSSGQRDPIKLGISESGKILVVNGRHRLNAAIELDLPIKVKWTTSLEPSKHDVQRRTDGLGKVPNIEEARSRLTNTTKVKK